MSLTLFVKITDRGLKNRIRSYSQLGPPLYKIYSTKKTEYRLYAGLN